MKLWANREKLETNRAAWPVPVLWWIGIMLVCAASWGVLFGVLAVRGFRW